MKLHLYQVTMADILHQRVLCNYQDVIITSTASFLSANCNLYFLSITDFMFTISKRKLVILEIFKPW